MFVAFCSGCSYIPVVLIRPFIHSTTKCRVLCFISPFFDKCYGFNWSETGSQTKESNLGPIKGLYCTVWGLIPQPINNVIM